MNASAPRRILLGLTGGIAAYKAAELTRLLVTGGHDVRVVMTEAACRFITPVTMQALSGQAVATDLWDDSVANAMGHIELSRDRELIVVAPASADFIAKLANGLADDLLSTLCVARECPLLVAPAMNRQMWDNAATQRNVRRLQEDGVRILGPASGDQACGEVGMGRMLEAAQLYAEILAALQPQLLSGVRVLITAGPTFEAIDAVRGITNRSSGRMGYAVAQAALEAGAQVTLVSGPTALVPPAGAKVVRTVSRRGHARGGRRGSRQCTDLHQRGRGGGLPRGQTQRAEDQEERSGVDDRAAAHCGHSRNGRCTAQPAVLCRFRRREPEPRSVRRGQAAAQEASAAGGQRGAGSDRRRRERDRPVRRRRQAPAAAGAEDRTGTGAGAAYCAAVRGRDDGDSAV